MDPITNLDLLRHAHTRRHREPALPRLAVWEERPGLVAAFRAILGPLLRRTAPGD